MSTPTFPTDARRWANLCAEWHGGQWSAFYSLASTGQIHSPAHAFGVCHEARKILNNLACMARHPEDRYELAALLEYCDELSSEE